MSAPMRPLDECPALQIEMQKSPRAGMLFDALDVAEQKRKVDYVNKGRTAFERALRAQEVVSFIMAAES